MSQIFDSLRRGRLSTATPASAKQTAQGDATLATLSYGPLRRNTRYGSVVAVAAIAAVVVVVGWIIVYRVFLATGRF